MKVFLKFLNLCTVRKCSDPPSAAAYLCKWWLGSTWSLNDLILSRKMGAARVLQDVHKDELCEGNTQGYNT